MRGHAGRSGTGPVQAQVQVQAHRLPPLAGADRGAAGPSADAVPSSITKAWAVVMVRNVDPHATFAQVVALLRGGSDSAQSQPAPIAVARGQHDILAAYEDERDIAAVYRCVQGMSVTYAGEQRQINIIQRKQPPHEGEFTWDAVAADRLAAVRAQTQPALGRSTGIIPADQSSAEVVPESITRSWHVLNVRCLNKFHTDQETIDTLRGGPSHPLPAPVAVKRTQDELGRFLVLAAYESEQQSRAACQTLEGFQTFWGRLPMTVLADAYGKPAPGEFRWDNVAPAKVDALREQHRQQQSALRSGPLAMRTSPAVQASPRQVRPPEPAPA